MKVTGTPRTGTEQLLLTGTWDDALYHVDFSPLAGSKVFLDTQYVTIVDKDWVISSIRRTMAEQGILLENNKDKANVIVEAAFGAYGTDQRDRKFGLPGISLTPSLTTGAAVERRIIQLAQLLGDQPARRGGQGTLFAYEAKTGRLVWESAPLYQRTRRSRPLRDRLRPLPVELASRGRNSIPTESQSQTRKHLFRQIFGH